MFLDPTVRVRLFAKIPKILLPNEERKLSWTISQFILKELGKQIFLIDGVLPSPSTGGKITLQELRDMVYSGTPLLITFVATEAESKGIYYRSRTEIELLIELEEIERRVHMLTGKNYRELPDDVDAMLNSDNDSLSRIQTELVKRMIMTDWQPPVFTNT